MEHPTPRRHRHPWDTVQGWRSILRRSLGRGHLRCRWPLPFPTPLCFLFYRITRKRRSQIQGERRRRRHQFRRRRRRPSGRVSLPGLGPGRRRRSGAEPNTSSRGSALEDGCGLASAKRGTRDEIYGDGPEGEESHFNTMSFPDDSATRYKGASSSTSSFPQVEGGDFFSLNKRARRLPAFNQ